MQKRKPKLGQNFLVDDAARHRIADALGDISSKTVIEIGPGHGAITGILADRAQRLVCIELDRSLVPELRFRFRNHANVEIIEADILETDLGSLIGAGKADVIGNLPYYITSDILLHLFRLADKIGVAVVMLQLEVAERVAAQPGVRDFGLLSATAQMYARVENIMTVPPQSFSPPPEVHSAVLRLEMAPRFEELGIEDETGFQRFLRLCFAQKRKTLGNNLRNDGLSMAEVETACERAGLSAQVRAEAVGLESFAALYRAIRESGKDA